MDVTITQHMQSIIRQIKISFPSIKFREGEIFVWRPRTRQILHPPLKNVQDINSLLHEVAHAELEHIDFNLDIELLSHEVAAWEHTRHKLAPMFDIKIDENFIEEQLDTYRLWLHSRSLCPKCGHNGFQTNQNTYSCNNCRCLWHVNEARICRLKRIRQQDPNRFF